MHFFRVLHLSDLHIGDTYMAAKDIAYRIISDIENERIDNIKSVIITGDIFEGKYNFSDKLIAEAVSFFNTLFTELNKTTKIDKTDFLFVPGNHDIIRCEETEEQWKKYQTFLTEFYGKLPSFYDPQDFSLLKVYDQNKVVFAGFNSCNLKNESIIDPALIKNLEKIEPSYFNQFELKKEEVIQFLEEQKSSKKLMDFGEISSEQILKVRRKLKEFDDYNIAAFFHHHFYLFPEVYTKYGDSSLIRNYTNVIQQMQQSGVRTIFHGHKHFDLERPLITDSYYESANNIINIFAGGSIGSSRKSKHTFNIIDLYDQENDYKLVQRKFTYNNDQLEPITIRQIPPERNNNDSAINLFNILKLNDHNLFCKYLEATEKINFATDDFTHIIKWLENIFVGFEEIHKIFYNDSLCVFFLLFAMNYRVLHIKKGLGNEDIDISYYEILENLMLNETPDVGFNKLEFLEIFSETDLNQLKENCDTILNTLTNKKSKYYLSFCMIGIFITDIYLMLRYYAGSFYNKYIKYKVNIKLDETEFHQNVPVQKIMIHSDADRRSAFIDLRCNSATAHKLAVLFVKEFELIISRFEDYFKIVGLKLYYLTPKIEKNDIQNTIDNYNFEAYIPTLIPLLTGDNIYSKKEVFARELIQNSIDAIAVRHSKEVDFDHKIHITLGEKENRQFFRIRDFGTGMDRFKIERYFTSIGRSFYSGDEYRDMDISYKPISNFGIGFLSAFMICREIDVKTRYYTDDKKGLKLHIPNYDGCFFIEKDNELDVGTEITLYIDKKISHNITFDDITQYIQNIMLDINCEIVIENKLSKKNITIQSHNIRKSCDNKCVLFVPFLETGEIKPKIDLEQDVWTNNYIAQYSYGMFVNIGKLIRHSAGLVLNSGIKLNETSVKDVLSILFEKEISLPSQYSNYLSFNFPSNYLSIDVSREKISDCSKCINKPTFLVNLFTELYSQIQQYISLSQKNECNVKAINIYTFMNLMVSLCKEHDSLTNLANSIMSSRYVLYLRFNTSSIDLIVTKVGNKSNNAISFTKNNYNKCVKTFNDFFTINSNKKDFEAFSQNSERLYNTVRDLLDSIFMRKNYLSHEYPYNIYEFESGELYDFRLKEHMKKLLKYKKDNVVYTFLLFAAFLLNNFENKVNLTIMDFILQLLLGTTTLSDVENGKCCVTVEYEDIKRVINRLNNPNTNI